MMVFHVVNVILTEVSLNSLVMSLVSFPTLLNFAHLDPVGFFLLLVLLGLSDVDTSYLLLCEMCLRTLLSFFLFIGHV
jgi:hypothetical protein